MHNHSSYDISAKTNLYYELACIQTALQHAENPLYLDRSRDKAEEAIKRIREYANKAERILHG